MDGVEPADTNVDDGNEPTDVTNRGDSRRYASTLVTIPPGVHRRNAERTSASITSPAAADSARVFAGKSHPHDSHTSTEIHDRRDGDSLLRVLTNEVIPLYYRERIVARTSRTIAPARVLTRRSVTYSSQSALFRSASTRRISIRMRSPSISMPGGGAGRKRGSLGPRLQARAAVQSSR